MGTVALIGLGSNLGDRNALLGSAVAELATIAGIRVSAVSSFHETAPVGGPAGQGRFLNGAARLDTTLSPMELLGALQAVERHAGRARPEPWAARTLDLDLLLFGERTIDEGAKLKVPHPWLRFRRFVLAPLAEIAPDAVDPVTRLTVRALLANVDRRPSYVAICDPFDRFAGPLEAELVKSLNAIPCGPGLNAHEPGAASAVLGEIHTSLTRTNWAKSPAEDRWLVTRYWFEGFVHGTQNALPSAERDGFRAAAALVCGTIVKPTFVVAEPPDVSFYRGDVPILPVSASAPEGLVSRVLNACAATRAG